MNLTSASPAGPIRVALVGCGRWGASLANAVVALPEFALNWVCDPVVRRPDARWAPAFSDEVCGDVDAVVVATPPELHLGPTLQALRGGKAVLVEKPFVQSLTELKQVQAASGETPILVGHLLAYHPGYLALMDWVRCSDRAVTIDVVRRSPARGANRCPWWTLAPHDLALLTRLFGEPNDLRLVPSADGVQAQLSWSRSSATLSYCTAASTKTRCWRLSNGASDAAFDEISGALSVRRVTAKVTSFSDANPLRAELLHFAQCVRREVPALTGLDEAEVSVRLLCWGEQQLRAARRGRVHEVRPHTEATGNP